GDAIVTGLAVQPDGGLLVTVGGNTVVAWRLPEGERQAEMKHPLAVSGAAFLPDGKLLTTCFDGAVRFWNPATGAELMQLELGMGKIYRLAVSPDQMTFVAGVERKCRIVVMDVP